MSTTNTPAFEIVTSPAVVETASVFGLHYAKGMLSREVAREFRAAFNATATRMMTAVLKNQQAGTEYA
jgi:hypothetical protein